MSNQGKSPKSSQGNQRVWVTLALGMGSLALCYVIYTTQKRNDGRTQGDDDDGNPNIGSGDTGTGGLGGYISPAESQHSDHSNHSHHDTDTNTDIDAGIGTGIDIDTGIDIGTGKPNNDDTPVEKTDYEKFVEKATYGATLVPSLWQVRQAPQGDTNIYYKENQIKEFLQKRVPNLMDKKTNPGSNSESAKRPFAQFVADLYLGQKLFQNLPGLDTSDSKKTTAQFVRIIINAIMRQPAVFGLDQKKINNHDAKELAKFQAIQTKQLENLFEGTQACNAETRLKAYTMVAEYTSVLGGLKAQIVQLFEGQKMATLDLMIARHDANIIQPGKETEAFKQGKGAQHQLPHKRARYIHELGKNHLGINPDIVKGDRFLDSVGNKVKIMPNDHWDLNGTTRVKKPNPPHLRNMEKKFVGEYKRRVSLRIVDVLDTVVTSIKDNTRFIEIDQGELQKLKQSNPNKLLNDGDVSKVDFRSFQNYYKNHIGITKPKIKPDQEDDTDDPTQEQEIIREGMEPTQNKRKTYDILTARGDIKATVDKNNNHAYHITRAFVLFILEDMGLIEGFYDGFMAAIRKENKELTVSYGTKIKRTKIGEKQLTKTRKQDIFKTETIHKLVTKPYQELEKDLEKGIGNGGCELYGKEKEDDASDA